MADGDGRGSSKCCRCGSEDHLASCSQCGRPVCPRCRASPGGADEYMCVSECVMASFLGRSQHGEGVHVGWLAGLTGLGKVVLIILIAVWAVWVILSK